MNVLFVCVQSAGPSQMAEALGPIEKRAIRDEIAVRVDALLAELDGKTST